MSSASKSARRLFKLCLAVGAVAACGDTQVQQVVTIGDQTYAIPEAHIVTQTSQPHRFIRVRQPNSPFELVHDSRSERERDQHGWARIFGINEGRTPDIDYFNTGQRIVVCRRAVHPVSACGTRIRHGRAEWSVIFPIARRDETERFVSEATALLKTYQASGS